MTDTPRPQASAAESNDTQRCLSIVSSLKLRFRFANGASHACCRNDSNSRRRKSKQESSRSRWMSWYIGPNDLLSVQCSLSEWTALRPLSSSLNARGQFMRTTPAAFAISRDISSEPESATFSGWVLSVGKLLTARRDDNS
ncbi:hypothetical protein D3C80_1096190 [compost metagenome]